MPTQIAKLDFWNYKSYLETSSNLTLAETADYITKTTGGRFLNDDSSYIRNIVTTNPVNNNYLSPETYYKKGSNYNGAYLFGPNSGVTATATLLGECQNGFELHLNDGYLGGLSLGQAIAFTFAGITYYLEWTATGLQLLSSVNVAVNIISFVGSSDANRPVTGWSEIRIGVSISGDNPNKQLTVKIFGRCGANTVLGHYTTALDQNGTLTLMRLKRSQSVGYGAMDNISVYSLTSGEASTIASNWGTQAAVNNLAPFQRYAPMLDIQPIFGDTWGNGTTVTPAAAFAAMTDGSLTTYGMTDSKDKPIGYVSADPAVGSVATAVTPNKLYMINAAGVNQDFTSVGGPDIGEPENVEGYVFTASGTNAAWAGDYLYPLLTAGDIMGRCYFLTPGTITQVPPLGIIKSIGSVGFAVATSVIETEQFKFSAVGDAEIVFDTGTFEATDVATTGNIAGETLAYAKFASGSGNFTGVTATTSKPIAFTVEREP